jgi:hypothetical protein
LRPEQPAGPIPDETADVEIIREHFVDIREHPEGLEDIEHIDDERANLLHTIIENINEASVASIAQYWKDPRIRAELDGASRGAGMGPQALILGLPETVGGLRAVDEAIRGHIDREVLREWAIAQRLRDAVDRDIENAADIEMVQPDIRPPALRAEQPVVPGGQGDIPTGAMLATVEHLIHTLGQNGASSSIAAQEYSAIAIAQAGGHPVRADIQPPSMRRVVPALGHIADIPVEERRIIGRWTTSVDIAQEQGPLAPEDEMDIEEQGQFAPGGNGIDEPPSHLPERVISPSGATAGDSE